MLVWQELFNIYEAGGGDLQYLDSFLCDLYSLKEAFDKGDFILYWYFTDQGYTSLLGYHEPGFYAYEIRYNIDQKTITITAL